MFPVLVNATVQTRRFVGSISHPYQVPTNLLGNPIILPFKIPLLLVHVSVTLPCSRLASLTWITMSSQLVSPNSPGPLHIIFHTVFRVIFIKLKCLSPSLVPHFPYNKIFVVTNYIIILLIVLLV